ncbi:MAG: hypothetical protein H7061_09850 [Bdellovibrionaceae bacterium]|nr:hypothetical protein [Bdellovibrio sp.]
MRNRACESLPVGPKSFWFHAASGEIEYVKSIILRLRKDYPSCRIIVTYSSPSAEKLFTNVVSAVDFFIPIPWDQPTALHALIKKISPQILIISRTDFWPEMIYQAQIKSIPIAIVSYYAALTTIKSVLYRWLLKSVRYISCVDQGQANELKILLPQVDLIHADGDTRFDQVFWRLAQPSGVKITSSSPLFVCGSTWKEDEFHLQAIYSQIRKMNFRIVLSPHEVATENIQRLAQYLETRAFTYTLLSSYMQTNHELTTDFLIVDRIGYLADIYRYAEIAFVGGSFKDKVHSVMEPLCSGLPVIVGPHFHNNPEANKYQNALAPRLIYRAQNSEDILEAFEKIKAEKQGLKEKIIAIVSENKNSTEKIVHTLINNVLKKANF